MHPYRLKRKTSRPGKDYDRSTDAIFHDMCRYEKRSRDFHRVLFEKIESKVKGLFINESLQTKILFALSDLKQSHQKRNSPKNHAELLTLVSQDDLIFTMISKELTELAQQIANNKIDMN